MSQSPKNKPHLLKILLISFAVIIFSGILLLTLLPTSLLTWVNNLAVNNPKIFSIAQSLVKTTDIPFKLISQVVPDKLPNYYLEISPANLNELNTNLPTDINKKLTDEFKQEVGAKFIFQGQEFPVEVRYRGDNANHWFYDKKSWRINFVDKQFNSASSIDLIIPQDRGYFQEITVNFIAQKMNLTAPNLKMVNLFVNGERQGVYLEAEHWSKSFLEERGQAATNNLYGENDFTYFFPGSVYYSPAQLKKFHTDENNSISDFSELDLFMSALKESDNDIFLKKIQQIVDMDNFLNWQALSTLMFSRSQRDSHNLILNFNSQTGKLEFIPWNITMTANNIATEPINVDYNTLMTRVLKDDKLYAKRNKILWNFVKDDSNLDDVFNFLDQVTKNTRFDIYKGPLRQFSVIEMIVSTNKFKRQLTTAFKKIKKWVQLGQVAIFVTTNPKEENYQQNIAYIDLENRGFSPTQIHEISLELSSTPSGDISLILDKNNNKKLDNQDSLLASFTYDKWNKKSLSVTVKAKLEDLIVATKENWPDSTGEIEPQTPDQLRQRLFVVADQNFKLIDLKTKTTNAATSEKNEVFAIRLIDDSTFRYANQITLSKEEFLSNHLNFVSGKDNQIILGPGVHFFNQPTIIPKSLKLQIMPGTTLKFAPHISLISYSQVEASGTADRPIIFTSQTREPWGVFAVVGKLKSTSKFSHVLVENAGEDHINGVYFTGGLAIHYSDAEIQNCTFMNNHGDDGLNIKHAQVEISASTFIDNQFDGLDLDVATGKITSNKFENNQNDGIDVSMSQLSLEDNISTNNQDKCFSIGEKSDILAEGNTFSGCNMGIAVKDLSTAVIDRNNIHDNHIGIAAYQKKAIFGGGTVKLGHNQLFANQEDFDISSNSTLINHE